MQLFLLSLVTRQEINIDDSRSYVIPNIYPFSLTVSKCYMKQLGHKLDRKWHIIDRRNQYLPSYGSCERLPTFDRNRINLIVEVVRAPLNTLINFRTKKEIFNDRILLRVDLI